MTLLSEITKLMMIPKIASALYIYIPLASKIKLRSILRRNTPSKLMLLSKLTLVAWNWALGAVKTLKSGLLKPMLLELPH